MSGFAASSIVGVSGQRRRCFTKLIFRAKRSLDATKRQLSDPNVRRAELHVVQGAPIELLQSSHVPYVIHTGAAQKIRDHENIVKDKANNFWN
jgi:hypothetical protein